MAKAYNTVHLDTVRRNRCSCEVEEQKQICFSGVSGRYYVNPEVCFPHTVTGCMQIISKVIIFEDMAMSVQYDTECLAMLFLVMTGGCARTWPRLL